MSTLLKELRRVKPRMYCTSMCICVRTTRRSSLRNARTRSHGAAREGNKALVVIHDVVPSLHGDSASHHGGGGVVVLDGSQHGRVLRDVRAHAHDVGQPGAVERAAAGCGLLLGFEPKVKLILHAPAAVGGVLHAALQ
eukprot:227168-Rhodomonas_salina.1